MTTHYWTIENNLAVLHGDARTVRYNYESIKATLRNVQNSTAFVTPERQAYFMNLYEQGVAMLETHLRDALNLKDGKA